MDKEIKAMWILILVLCLLIGFLIGDNYPQNWECVEWGDKFIGIGLNETKRGELSHDDLTTMPWDLEGAQKWAFEKDIFYIETEKVCIKEGLMREIGK